MAVVEVTWETKPKSGITEIELSDLGCKSEKEWHNLTDNEKKKRIKPILDERDSCTLRAVATDWFVIKD